MGKAILPWGRTAIRRLWDSGTAGEHWGWNVSFPLTGKGGTVTKIIEQEV